MPNYNESPATGEIYVSTYCNFAHRLADGKPVEHECRIIPPAALKAEMKDDFPKAIQILRETPARWMRRGVKASALPEANKGDKP